ncbi:Cholesterol 25-hydroxylase-like protein [Acipenser ruthenus]|uniref:Cholesterol 25-hydroxylase-like protein n=1 Tax=Acipenser ruthenus TaxID=7906 RepID=A0A444UAH0_ACIRT|nr:Cholesterol 25-hydroxylase-like protein [Acipenser ruthenus]
MKWSNHSRLHDCTATRMQDTLVLQNTWDVMRANDNLLKSPFFPVLFSFTVYMAFCLPFVLLDVFSPKLTFLRKYKIQQQNYPTWAMIRICIIQTVYNHIVFIFPLTVAHWYWRPVTYPVQAPGLVKALLDILACLLLFDFQNFVWHLVHHKVPWLYKNFHKVHHKHTSTFALTTEHSGAWETLSLGFFAAINPLLLNCHPLTEMLFFVVNIWLSVEDHSGYDFPWSTHRLVPFGLFGGAPHHDGHHLKFKFNYAPYFTHWDRLFGTLLKTSVKEN